MKKFLAIIVSFVLVLVAALSATPIMAALAAEPNLIPNASLEQSVSGRPVSWASNKWGTNTSTFTYRTTEGRTGTSSVTTKTTSYKSGDAKWSFTPVAVKPNTTYTFSDWYKSNAKSTIDVEVTSTANTLSYIWLGDRASSNNTWNQAVYTFKTPANAAKVTIYHSLSAVGEITTDDYSLTDPASTPATAPTVHVTAPAANSTVSGAVSLGADAADAQSITSVLFKVDGVNVGAADTATPYTVGWDTTAIANGAHTVTAVATNTSGLTTTSSPVAINVQNSVTPAPAPAPAPANNLIANESVENGTPAPNSWIGDGWGSNTRILSYEATGRTGTHSLKAAITSYQDGDAKWYFKEVPVTAGKTYIYSNYYRSNVATELDAMVTMSNGSIQYYWLGSFGASPSDWQKASADFVVPAGAVSMTIFQVISSVGYVQTDDFSLTEYLPAKFNRALVSITFDDGWRNIYTNGYPLLQKYGLTSTQYLNSEPVMGGWDDYMTYQMLKDWKNAGHELGWHTRTHTDITKLSSTALNTELTIPSAFLTGSGTVASEYRNFASPYGAYNTASVNQVLQKYRSHRSTDVGYNTRDNFSVTNIRVQNITNTTTPAQVQAWVRQAQTDNSWLVLVYHEVTANAADPTYAVTPANLDQELNLIRQSGVTVKTVQQALDEIMAQL